MGSQRSLHTARELCILPGSPSQTLGTSEGQYKPPFLSYTKAGVFSSEGAGRIVGRSPSSGTSGAYPEREKFRSKSLEDKTKTCLLAFSQTPTK